LEKAGNGDQNLTAVVKRKSLTRTAKHDPAYLHCPIPQFPDQIAAWTRLSDRAILTHGETTFTSDPRFQLSLKQAEHDWVLIIRRAELSDSGCYLCEINTEPKSTIYTVYLEVDAPAQEPSKQGTTKLVISQDNKNIMLNCTISVPYGLLPLDGDVIWTRDGNLINYKDTNKYILKVKRDNRSIVQTLQILEPSQEDDGTYACFAADAPISSRLLRINYSYIQNTVPQLNIYSSSFFFFYRF
uniref:Ig-like domain-containing protein n=1 Tax=Syphacia muris TaxID=451379 RepID=A0A0N5AJ52_9BILA